MKDIDWIMQEQIALLKDKGYDEAGLHTIDAAGSCILQIKDQLRDIIDNPDLQYAASYFNVHLFGQFGKDTVAYALTYIFEPLDQTLHLTAVSASIDQTKLVEQIEKPSELWNAKELYLRVQQMNQVVGPHLEQARQKAVQSALVYQANLLSQKGYGNYEQILTKLNIELAGVLDEKSHERSFVLKHKIKEPNFINPLYARFHFHFKPAVPSLHLKSIHFSMSRQTDLVLQPKERDIPIPRVICSRLADAATTKSVNKILDQLNSQQPAGQQQKKGKT